MKKIVMLAALVACGSFVAHAQKEYKLQYSFKKGETFEWNQTSSIKQHIVGPGFEQNADTKIIANTTLKVTELTATGAKFEIEYTKLSMESPQAGINMDSEGDTTKNLPNKIMQAMKGKKFNFVLTKHGHVESVENSENIWSGLTAKNGFQESQVAVMKAQLENQFGKTSIKQGLDAAFVKYPENKIKVGINWNSNSEMTAPIPMKTDYSWTLESAADPAGVLVGDAKLMTTDTTKVITLPQGFKATTNFKGRRVVKGNVNLSTGWPETFKSYAEQKGFMVLLAGGQIPEDMKMDMEVSTDSEYSFKKK